MTHKVSVPTHSNELSPELVAEFVEIHQQKTLNEAKKLHLKEKEMELGARYSEKMLDFQMQMMNRRPVEARKTFTRLGWIIGVFVLLLFGFLTSWIFMGKEQFAYKFLQGSGYLLSTVLGYLMGSKYKVKKEEKKEPVIAEAEIVP